MSATEFNMVVIPTAFFVGVLLMLFLAWLSSDHVHQKVGLILLAGWAASNVVVNFGGFDLAWKVIPSLDAALAVATAYLGYTNRSRIALIVFAIFAVVGAVHVGAIISGAQVTNLYYTVTGTLFAAQLVAVGASGAWLAIRAWLDTGGERFRPHLARR